MHKGDERLERPTQLSLVEAGKVADKLCFGSYRVFAGLFFGLFGGCWRHSGVGQCNHGETFSGLISGEPVRLYSASGAVVDDGRGVANAAMRIKVVGGAKPQRSKNCEKLRLLKLHAAGPMAYGALQEQARFIDAQRIANARSIPGIWWWRCHGPTAPWTAPLVRHVWGIRQFSMPPDDAGLASAIRDQLAHSYGQHGLLLAERSLQGNVRHLYHHGTQPCTVKYYNPLTCLALLRCARDQLPQVCKALSGLGLINGKHVDAHVTLVSGMWRACSLVLARTSSQGRLARCQQAVQEQEAPILQAARLNDRVRGGCCDVRWQQCGIPQKRTLADLYANKLSAVEV